MSKIIADEDSSNFAKGCIFGTLMSMPFWIGFYYLVKFLMIKH